MQILQLLYMGESGVNDDLSGILLFAVLVFLLAPVVDGCVVSYQIWKKRRKKC